MSFIDDIVSVGSDIYKSVTASQIGGSLLKTAALGLLLNQVNSSINKENSVPAAANSSQPDRFVREQLSPDTNHTVPVVYGTAFIKGIITDAVMTNSNGTMWYCITICEKTGTLLSTGADSVISFDKIYLNGCEIGFQSDGITVASSIDDDEVVNTQMNGKIQIYCFNNGSNSPVLPTGFSNPTLSNATAIFPNWSANHTMSALVFALIKVDYDKTNNVTGLGEIEFQITNTLTQPGDVLYDYITNERYGAGIDPAEVYSS